MLPVAFLAIGLAGYFLLVFFKQESAVIETTVKAWPVKVMPVKFGSHSRVLTLYGVVENPGKKKITAPAASYIVKLPVSEGQVVEQGGVLVKLDERDFLPKLQSAEADVAQIKSQLANLKLQHETDRSTRQTEKKVLQLKQLELSRMQSLLQRKLGSQVAVDQAEQALQVQKLAVSQRELALREFANKTDELQARLKKALADRDLARLQLERSQVSAQSTVVIGRVNAAVGDRVQQNQPLFTVYPLNTMQVRAKIPAPDLTTVQSALMSSDTRHTPLLAKTNHLGIILELVRLAGEADTRGIDALFAVNDHHDILRKGMALTLHLELPPEPHSLLIPYQVIYGMDQAYQVVDNRLHSITLKRLGEALDAHGLTHALVNSDVLNEGDLLMITHLPNAVNGLLVKPHLDE